MPLCISPYLYVDDRHRALAAESGHDCFTLAFVTGYAHGKAVWDAGVAPCAGFAKGLKRVTVSFGGAGSKTNELAGAIKDVRALAKAYEDVARTYGAAELDFDVEGGSLGDHAAIARRNAALALLPADIALSYTLPVMPSGLDAASVALLRDAAKRGVRVGTVRVMAMDYGTHTRDMAAAAVQAAKAAYRQVQAAGLARARIGIIPMIGVNDTAGERFTLRDAMALREFAAATPWVSTLSYWSLNRDRGARVSATASDAESGVVQAPFEFLHVLTGRKSL